MKHEYFKVSSASVSDIYRSLTLARYLLICWRLEAISNFKILKKLACRNRICFQKVIQIECQDCVILIMCWALWNCTLFKKTKFFWHKRVIKIIDPKCLHRLRLQIFYSRFQSIGLNLDFLNIVTKNLFFKLLSILSF